MVRTSPSHLAADLRIPEIRIAGDRSDWPLQLFFMFKLLSQFRRRGSSLPDGSDSLDAFASEAARAAGPTSARPLRAGNREILIVVGAIATVAAAYGFVKWTPFRAEASSASVTIESDPRGAEVIAQGVRQGVTPLVLTIPPGEHLFEIVQAGRRKPVHVTARAGTAVVHHVEFGPAAETAAPLPAATTGATGSRTAARKVPSAAVPAGPAAGWLVVNSPIALDIMEKDQVIGTTAASRIMLPAGRKELRFVNEALGFSERAVVQVSAGATAKVAVKVPRAPLSINAVPWAEVLIDGVRVGETPIGNHMVSIGKREVVFRHPELGERRQTVTVSLTTPARVSVDMRKAQQ
jgi:hypothetical protein